MGKRGRKKGRGAKRGRGGKNGRGSKHVGEITDNAFGGKKYKNKKKGGNKKKKQIDLNIPKEFKKYCGGKGHSHSKYYHSEGDGDDKGLGCY